MRSASAIPGEKPPDRKSLLGSPDCKESREIKGRQAHLAFFQTLLASLRFSLGFCLFLHRRSTVSMLAAFGLLLAGALLVTAWNTRRGPASLCLQYEEKRLGYRGTGPRL
jgi:hypothetical protein